MLVIFTALQKLKGILQEDGKTRITTTTVHKTTNKAQKQMVWHVTHGRVIRLKHMINSGPRKEPQSWIDSKSEQKNRKPSEVVAIRAGGKTYAELVKVVGHSKRT